jgi:divinyl protochlorophyllide a 8-vinyl-reductase
MMPARTAIIDTGGVGTIGPNAVIQLIRPLRDAQLAESVFAAAGATDWLIDPPAAMVDERRVARLHRAVRAAAPRDEALRLLAEAGRLTADYIMANRIPRQARAVLQRLPAPIACRLFVAAVRAHAWTFAGSARFAAQAGAPTVFTLIGNPLCGGIGNPLCGGIGNPLCGGIGNPLCEGVGNPRCGAAQAPSPVCSWHAAVFQRLFEVLVSPRSRVVETACEAAGDGCCRFEIDWRPSAVVRRQ